MQTLETLTVDKIDKGTPEGQLLWTAIGVIAFLIFRNKSPALILALLKGIKTDVLTKEPLDATMQRIEESLSNQKPPTPANPPRNPNSPKHYG